MPQVAGLDIGRAQIAPIAAISVFGLSMSMSYPLFALLLERAGTSSLMIGLNAMGAALSMVVFAPLMPLILRAAGMGSLMIGAGLVMAAIFLLAPLWHHIAWWSFLRVAYGFAGTALFFASEYWIVSAAPPASRGRIVALYGISLSASFMAGPLLLRLTGLEGFLPFGLSAGIVLVALAPIIWGLGAAPTPDPEARPRLLDAIRFFVSDPALVWAVFLFGTLEFGALALFSVWGVRVGLVEANAVLLLSAFALGAMLLQLPVGWAADRFKPRPLLAIGSAGCFAAPLLLVASAPDLVLLVPVTLVWGGLGAALYSVALIGLGARYSGERLAAANAAVIWAYGLGALMSPPLFGLAMDWSDPHGLLWSSAAFALVYLVLVAARMAHGAREPKRP